MREKDFVHQCPNCKNLFPSNHESFGRSMGSHLRYCMGTQAQPSEGENSKRKRNDEEEWEDVLLEESTDQGDGDGTVEFDQDLYMEQDQSGGESLQLDRMGEEMRQEMFSLKEHRGSMTGGIEELFEDGDFRGESSSDTSEEDEAMTSGATREFCGAQLVELNTSGWMSSQPIGDLLCPLSWSCLSMSLSPSLLSLSVSLSLCLLPAGQLRLRVSSSKLNERPTGGSRHPGPPSTPRPPSCVPL